MSLAKGAETRLCDALGLKRVAVLGIMVLGFEVMANSRMGRPEQRHSWGWWTTGSRGFKVRGCEDGKVNFVPDLRSIQVTI